MSSPSAVSRLSENCRVGVLACGELDTDGMYDQMAEVGYLVIPRLCHDADLLSIEEILLRLFSHEAGYSEGNLIDMLGPDVEVSHALQPQLINPSLYAPELLLTNYFEEVQKIAKQLLGEDAEFSFDHSILRRPGHSATTPWHQDEAHNNDPHFRREQVSFWMPLHDVDEGNGCLRYIPVSQQQPLLPHRVLGNDPKVHALEVTPGSVNESEARAVPLQAGGCVAHAGRTLHASMPNITCDAWIAYVLVFQGPLVPRTTTLVPATTRGQRSAAAAAIRRRHWLWRGGVAVLAKRWCLRWLRSDRHAVLNRLRQRLNRYISRGARH